MRRKAIKGSAVFFALLLSGCSSTDRAAACDPNPEAATVSRGGLSTQALTNNSMSMNGLSLNSLSLNSLSLNSLTLNGISLNSISMNGLSLNSISLNSLSLNGTGLAGVAANELVATTADGRSLSGDALVGAQLDAVLSNGMTIGLTIAAFERNSDEGLAYYELDYQGRNLCAAGDKGLFLPGVWDDKAAQHDQLTVGGHTIGTSFACTSGVLAKCVRWGYAPWKVGAELHQACVRMGRADYCGSGVSFTKNGTAIDLYDVKGIQTPAGDSTFQFEAGWGANGAVCVSRTRYDAHSLGGESILPSCWASLPRCGSFADAQSQGAIIANSSRIQPRTLCSN
jgi:hypothetical protein